MDKKPLNFASLMGYLAQAISSMMDPRSSSPNRRYSLYDLVVGAFSAFYMQCESFLGHQRILESHRGQNNARSLFGIIKIPSDPQIRNVLDKIASSSLFRVFEEIYRSLQRHGVLARYEYLGGQLLIALDGTEYFSSETIHCEQCSHQTNSKGEVRYFHRAILPVIVSPEQSAVISLAPEFITPQDGHEKQDCETMAAKRWVIRQKGAFLPYQVTLLGDDLFSRQPMCETVVNAGMNYIFTCLPTSHPTLYEWVTAIERLGEVHRFEEQRDHLRRHEIYQYRYANQVPLRDELPTLNVNWCELTVIRVSDGKQLYQNAWITQHHLNEAMVVQVAAAGRCRWKTENENHNVLKTKGYFLEHNFGHGHHHLSQTLLTLNVLAFLFHTVLQLVDNSYQTARKMCGTRQIFFRDLRSLTKYFVFDSWQVLIDFIISDQLPPQTVDSS